MIQEKNALILRTSADILENAVILGKCTATVKHKNTGKNAVLLRTSAGTGKRILEKCTKTDRKH